MIREVIIQYIANRISETYPSIYVVKDYDPTYGSYLVLTTYHVRALIVIKDSHIKFLQVAYDLNDPQTLSLICSRIGSWVVNNGSM